MINKIYFRPQSPQLLDALAAHQQGNFLPNTNAALNHALSCYFFGNNTQPPMPPQPPQSQAPQTSRNSSMSPPFETDGWD